MLDVVASGWLAFFCCYRVAPIVLHKAYATTVRNEGQVICFLQVVLNIVSVIVLRVSEVRSPYAIYLTCCICLLAAGTSRQGGFTVSEKGHSTDQITPLPLFRSLNQNFHTCNYIFIPPRLIPRALSRPPHNTRPPSSPTFPSSRFAGRSGGEKKGKRNSEFA